MHEGKRSNEGQSLKSVLAAIYNIAMWRPKDKWFTANDFKDEAPRKKTGRQAIEMMAAMMGVKVGESGSD
ncbi:hypothetical protein [Gimesia fumaroli]|uniref:Uncharacterized protein n=1 Tax=Gimesia fumaroli TaxID=2527976 RepID=A0A518IKU0_9PLAN|nr:hypothetical protein [Gimesia fumaroli]QDV53697.1 hypothetical protein Enr17x_57780 [Gimesia fumaroli]